MGEWVSAAGAGTIEVVSPATEEVIGQVPRRHARPTSTARSPPPRQAFDDGPWPHMTPVERAEVIGPPLAGAPGPLARTSPTRSRRRTARPSSGRSWARCSRRRWCSTPTSALATEYEWVDTRVGDDGRPGPGAAARPVGVVAAITPWNVPLFIAALKLGPAMVAGCPIVLKPSPETPLDSYLLAEAIIEAGVPAGRHQHRPRGPGDRRAPRDAPGHRQGQLHRLDRRGQAHRRGVRRPAQALHARARRQVGRDRPRRRRARRHAPRPAGAVGAHEQRPGLRRADPDPGVPQALRRGGRRARRRRRRAEGRRPAGRQPRRSARSSPSASGPGSRATSTPARPPGRGSSSAAAAPRTCRAAGTSSRPCSPTSTTP